MLGGWAKIVIRACKSSRIEPAQPPRTMTCSYINLLKDKNFFKTE